MRTRRGSRAAAPVASPSTRRQAPPAFRTRTCSLGAAPPRATASTRAQSSAGKVMRYRITRSGRRPLATSAARAFDSGGRARATVTRGSPSEPCGCRRMSAPRSCRADGADAPLRARRRCRAPEAPASPGSDYDPSALRRAAPCRARPAEAHRQPSVRSRSPTIGSRSTCSRRERRPAREHPERRPTGGRPRPRSWRSAAVARAPSRAAGSSSRSVASPRPPSAARGYGTRRAAAERRSGRDSGTPSSR